MEHLYAPWRSAYFEIPKNECVFCHISQNPKKDREHHVLFRNKHCFAVMNRFPYTPGHFMIIPHTHTADLELLELETWQNITALTQAGVRLLKEHFGAHGVNLGMNLGECGGAGIAEHIHLHLVPRFSKDTNFMTVLGETRVYPAPFERVYEQLLEGVGHYLGSADR